MKDTEPKVTNYSELFNQIEQNIKSTLPDRSRGLIQEFVGYRHVELKDKELIGSEKIVEVKNALQIIQRNAEKIPNFLCTPSEKREMLLDITEQIERIVSLLLE